MSQHSAAHELKTLVLSFHSLLTIETVEEERVRSLLIEVANDRPSSKPKKIYVKNAGVS